MVKWHEGVCEMLQQEAETEQARIAPEAHVSNHTSDHSRESSVQGRVAVDDAPDYFSSTHRGNREGNVEFAHVSFQPHQPRRRSAQDDHEDRRSHHARPRSSTEHPYKRDPYWFSHRSKPRPRSHRREYRDRRARSPSNTSVSSDSDTTDEERVSPRDTSNPGTSRHHDPERLFPPSTYRDRRHSHHSLNKPRGEDPPQSPRYVPHRHPSYPQPPRPQPVPPPGNGRGIDPRWRELDSRGSYPGSAPSTPGPYPGRAPTRFVDSGRESNEERPLVRRFVAPLRGVGGRRYPPDPTRGR